jgi:hypothetical protein
MNKIEEVLMRHAGIAVFKPRLAITLRKCSMEAKPYQAIYTEQPTGLYRLVECRRLEVDLGSSAGDAKQYQINVEPGFEKEVCAWCGCGPKRFAGSDHATTCILCSHCGWLVCPGKSYGMVFRCWCGTEGYLGDGVPLLGSVLSAVNPVQASRAGGQPVNSDSQVPNRLQLSSGKK